MTRTSSAFTRVFCATHTQDCRVILREAEAARRKQQRLRRTAQKQMERAQIHAHRVSMESTAVIAHM